MARFGWSSVAVIATLLPPLLTLMISVDDHGDWGKAPLLEEHELIAIRGSLPDYSPYNASFVCCPQSIGGVQNATCVCGAGNNPPCYDCYGVEPMSGLFSQGAPPTIQPNGGTDGSCSSFILEKGLCVNGVCNSNPVGGNCSGSFAYFVFQPQ